MHGELCLCATLPTQKQHKNIGGQVVRRITNIDKTIKTIAFFLNAALRFRFFSMICYLPVSWFRSG